MARTALVLAMAAVAAACGAADTAIIEVSERTAHIDVRNVRSTPVDRTGAVAVYMEISNDGAELDRLIDAQMTGCDITELQETSVEDGVMVMRPVDGGIAIPPLATVVLGPGALAVKCLQMDADLARGDTIAVTLVFAGAGTTTVTAVVTDEG